MSTPDLSNVLFSTTLNSLNNEQPVLVSLLRSQHFGLGLVYEPWKLRHIIIRKDGHLSIIKPDFNKRKNNNQILVKELDVRKVVVKTISIDNQKLSSFYNKQLGFHIKCKKLNGYDTYFRCILREEFIHQFLEALQEIDPADNLENTVRSKLMNSHENTSDGSSHVESQGNQSTMRKAITHAVDSYIIQDRNNQIISRRGVFRWLPVAFSNDLVHGSWWFAIGSIIMVISSIIILYNSYDDVIGDDDSLLSRYRYRATWLLIMISGIFFTLGSFAFIRAVHDEPPMKPLFSAYHVQNDELLGSWLFLLGTIPVVPYCFLYIVSGENVGIYAASSVVGSLIVVGASLFVWASYPSDKSNKQYVLRFVRYLCCCLCVSLDGLLTRHLANDWLAACWIIYYGTAMATIGMLGVFINDIVRKKGLSSFIFGSYFIENIFFLIGCKYFIAGSYPDDMLIEDISSDYVLVTDPQKSEEIL